MRKRMAAQFKILKSVEYPNTVSIIEDDFPVFDGEDGFYLGEWYSVIRRGLWWWKSWAIVYFIPDCGAPASQPGGGWWMDVKVGFKTKEEALAVLFAGGFPVFKNKA